jgi:enoyl-CoA hydratase
MFNCIEPDAFYGLAKAYYDFDNDSTLRAAVLFGHGENFSRGNDVEAFSALAKSGHAFKLGVSQIDPLGRAQKLSKPLVVVAHGKTWNMGHELHLAADIRVANADVRYAQTENAHGRVPGVAPVRMVREAGWANSMRYMLTGEWDANRIAACGPLGIKATLKVTHLAINDSADAAAFAQLETEYVLLFKSDDLMEGHKAEAENRAPVFHGR